MKCNGCFADKEEARKVHLAKLAELIGVHSSTENHASPL